MQAAFLLFAQVRVSVVSDICLLETKVSQVWILIFDDGENSNATPSSAITFSQPNDPWSTLQSEHERAEKKRCFDSATREHLAEPFIKSGKTTEYNSINKVQFVAVLWGELLVFVLSKSHSFSFANTLRESNTESLKCTTNSSACFCFLQGYVLKTENERRWQWSWRCYSTVTLHSTMRCSQLRPYAWLPLVHLCCGVTYLISVKEKTW